MKNIMKFIGLKFWQFCLLVGSLYVLFSGNVYKISKLLTEIGKELLSPFVPEAYQSQVGFVIVILAAFSLMAYVINIDSEKDKENSYHNLG